MNKEEVKTRVEQIIVDKLGIDPTEITPDSQLANDLGADSLDAIELVMEFEKEFNIGITDDEIMAATTTGDIRDISVTSLINIVHERVKS